MNFRPALFMTSRDLSASIDTRRSEFFPGEVLLLFDCLTSSWPFCSAFLRAMADCTNHLIEMGLAKRACEPEEIWRLLKVSSLVELAALTIPSVDG